jgi:hypothetical protein
VRKKKPEARRKKATEKGTENTEILFPRIPRIFGGIRG